MMLGGVLFAPGHRPTTGALRRLGDAGGAFAISRESPDDPGSAELLADGLTFDLVGLAPQRAVALPLDNVYGHAPRFDPARCEGVGLQPGPHLAGAEHLLPVVRVAAALLAALSTLAGAEGVVWAPSASVTPPAWFAQVVGAWLAGGPFPALALCAIRTTSAGGLASQGLDAIGAQDFILEASPGAAPGHLNRLAMRLADWSVAHGPVSKPGVIALPGMGSLSVRVDQQRLVARPNEDPEP